MINIFTAQKMKFSINDFSSKCDQIRSFLRIWPHLLEKSLIENFIFCAVFMGICKKTENWIKIISIRRWIATIKSCDVIVRTLSNIKAERFVKIVKRLLANIFAKRHVLNVWQGPEYVSETPPE